MENNKNGRTDTISKMNIIEAKQEHYEEVCELFKLLDLLHIDIAPGRIREFSGPARSKARYQQYTDGEKNVLFLAQDKNQFVGFINLMLIDVPEEAMNIKRKFALLDNIFVRETYQNEGIATQLMDIAEAWAKDKGASKIELQLYTNNEKALQFYQSMGFNPFMALMERNVK